MWLSDFRYASEGADYIDMLDPKSVRVLIDAVYEPHWQRYAAGG